MAKNILVCKENTIPAFIRRSPLISRMVIFKSLTVHFFEMLVNATAWSSAFVKVVNFERKLSTSYNVNLLFAALLISSDASKKLEIVSATSPAILKIFVKFTWRLVHYIKLKWTIFWTLKFLLPFFKIFIANLTIYLHINDIIAYKINCGAGPLIKNILIKEIKFV